MIYGEGRLKPSRARGKQQPDGSADQRGNRNPMGGPRTCERTRATAARWKERADTGALARRAHALPWLPSVLPPRWGRSKRQR